MTDMQMLESEGIPEWGVMATVMVHECFPLDPWGRRVTEEGLIKLVAMILREVERQVNK